MPLRKKPPVPKPCKEKALVPREPSEADEEEACKNKGKGKALVPRTEEAHAPRHGPLPKEAHIPPRELASRIDRLKRARICRRRLSAKFKPHHHARLRTFWEENTENCDVRLRITNGPMLVTKEMCKLPRIIPPGVPKFWLRAMCNHHKLQGMVRKFEFHALAFLKDIRVDYLDETDYVLSFHFRENDFFTNREIHKGFYFREWKGNKGEPKVLFEARGSPIEWKDGYGEKRLEDDSDTREWVSSSRHKFKLRENRWMPLFTWLSETVAADDKDQDSTAEALKEHLAAGEEFRDDLVPRAIDWYTGELFMKKIGE
ncbi:nucleosome assembly [Aspergillus nanangensis]|uniref:Nucleosome assembly n=1 Tax=Aspergillus nanangensis TaxID=2582783 RepID=A0AAD4GWH4_ASPNN|nr:nucleosome assembly [Aspergillus nanangensis]